MDCWIWEFIFMKKGLLFILLVGYVEVVCAQYEAANWYLYDVTGLDFKCNPPKRFDTNFAFTESCSISDSNGDVIIYSDSRTVWNSKGEIIENGNISHGENKDYNTHPMIIPYPGKDSVYLLFRLGGYKENENVFYYFSAGVSRPRGLWRLGSTIISIVW